MENASKALLMAAGVMVGMMILGVFVYLFRAGGKIGENYDKRQTQEQLQLINSKFENFNKNEKQCKENGEYNTIIDMISVTNLAISTNEEYEYSTYQAVAIDIVLSSSITLKVSDTKELKRNYLFKGNDTIYVYDLLDKDKNALSTALKGGIVTTMDDGDTLTTVNEYMNYKYCFICTDMKYHETSGRVNYMKFELIKNPNF